MNRLAMPCCLAFCTPSVPLILLREAFACWRWAAKVGVMHWIHDATTPRGPDLSIRRVQNSVRVVERGGFELIIPLVSLRPTTTAWSDANQSDQMCQQIQREIAPS